MQGLTQSTFWQNITSNIELLEKQSPDKISDFIYKNLKKEISKEVLVEVSYFENKFEVIFCGGHDNNLIEKITSLIARAPKIHNWIFIGPKPEMGFGFKININNISVNAATLLFTPIESKEFHNKLGIKVFSDALFGVKEGKDILWKILETGIGEKLASCIFYLEIGSGGTKNDYLSVTSLKDYIIWFNKNNIS